MRLRVKLKIRYGHTAQLKALMIVLCLVIITISALYWTQARAEAPTLVLPVKLPYQFYLTLDPPYYTGAQALTACAPGYHMASLWEMVDVTGLRYNHTLGDYRADMGRGPIGGIGGWVRTGDDANLTGLPGTANCNAWTSNIGQHVGTTAYLDADWDAAGEDIGVWNVGAGICSGTIRVWCMADVPGYPIYMPIVMHQ